MSCFKRSAVISFHLKSDRSAILCGSWNGDTSCGSIAAELEVALELLEEFSCSSQQIVIMPVAFLVLVEQCSIVACKALFSNSPYQTKLVMK
jgi:hypothetical protein